MFAKALGKRITLVAALVMGPLASAHALPFVWEDQTDLLDGAYVSVDNPYSYIHSIIEGLTGYRPGIDSVTTASLSIWLFDDHLSVVFPFITDSNETVGFRFDGGGWSSSAEVGGHLFDWDRFDFIVSSLLNDGLLNVTIRANRGDFVFAMSLLEASGDRGTTVPEPATLTLLGLGLLGLGCAVRRRLKPY